MSNTETYINNYVTQAESYINTVCKVNFSDLYTSLNVDVKGILKECASAHAAMSVINYDLTGYQSRHAETMLDFLSNQVRQCIDLLKEKDKTEYIRAA